MYLALYRKYRPQTFDDVISQPHITIPLKNQVKNGKTAHSYLFAGSRGTGKTSCSKILAKAVNCPHQVDGNPCLTCDICKGIDDGSLLDVVEIDAASNNGVDNIREIREEANFTPAVCKYRVYIIDEAHMLSDGAFNALLKIMEEPPAHIIFILATTEVHKIPATILSRCQRYDFKRILSEDIAARLHYVAGCESIALNDDAAALIAKISDGGMRDALSLLDRCTSMATEVVDVETVSNASGLAGRTYLFKLSDAIIAKDVTSALRYIDELNGTICNLSNLCDELITHFRNILIAKTVTKPSELIVATESEIDELVRTADRMQLDTILDIMERLQDCSTRMKKTSAKKLELEMAFVRICSQNTIGANGISNADIDFLRNRIGELEQLILSMQSGNAPTASKTTAPTKPAESAPTKKAEKIDFSKFKPVTYFAEILENLKQFDPALAGMLFDAKAYEYEDMMLIVTQRNLFADLFRNQVSAQHFSDAVFKQTGKRYRFKITQSTKAQEASAETAQAENPLDKLVEAAKSAGVEVN